MTPEPEVERLRRWLHLDVRSRIVEHLLLVARRDGDRLVVPGGANSRVKIAQVVGSIRETVSRILTELERGGLLTSNRRGVAVVSMDLAPALETLPATWGAPS